MPLRDSEYPQKIKRQQSRSDSIAFRFPHDNAAVRKCQTIFLEILGLTENELCDIVSAMMNEGVWQSRDCQTPF